MKKIIITKDKQVGFIEGPGAKGTKMTIIDNEGNEHSTEEIDASRVSEKDWEELKEKPELKTVNKIKRKNSL